LERRVFKQSASAKDFETWETVCIGKARDFVALVRVGKSQLDSAHRLRTFPPV
jgi:hypothetical protein